MAIFRHPLDSVKLGLLTFGQSQLYKYSGTTEFAASHEAFYEDLHKLPLWCPDLTAPLITAVFGKALPFLQQYVLKGRGVITRDTRKVVILLTTPSPVTPELSLPKDLPSLSGEDFLPKSYLLVTPSSPKPSPHPLTDLQTASTIFKNSSFYNNLHIYANAFILTNLISSSFDKKTFLLIIKYLSEKDLTSPADKRIKNLIKYLKDRKITIKPFQEIIISFFYPFIGSWLIRDIIDAFSKNIIELIHQQLFEENGEKLKDLLNKFSIGIRNFLTDYQTEKSINKEALQRFLFEQHTDLNKKENELLNNLIEIFFEKLLTKNPIQFFIEYQIKKYLDKQKFSTFPDKICYAIISISIHIFFRLKMFFIENILIKLVKKQLKNNAANWLKDALNFILDQQQLLYDKACSSLQNVLQKIPKQAEQQHTSTQEPKKSSTQPLQLKESEAKKASSQHSHQTKQQTERSSSSATTFTSSESTRLSALKENLRAIALVMHKILSKSTTTTESVKDNPIEVFLQILNGSIPADPTNPYERLIQIMHGTLPADPQNKLEKFLEEKILTPIRPFLEEIKKDENYGETLINLIIEHCLVPLLLAKTIPTLKDFLSIENLSEQMKAFMKMTVTYLSNPFVSGEEQLTTDLSDEEEQRMRMLRQMGGASLDAEHSTTDLLEQRTLSEEMRTAALRGPSISVRTRSVRTRSLRTSSVRAGSSEQSSPRRTTTVAEKRHEMIDLTRQLIKKGLQQQIKTLVENLKKYFPSSTNFSEITMPETTDATTLNAFDDIFKDKIRIEQCITDSAMPRVERYLSESEKLFFGPIVIHKIMSIAMEVLHESLS